MHILYFAMTTNVKHVLYNCEAVVPQLWSTWSTIIESAITLVINRINIGHQHNKHRQLI